MADLFGMPIEDLAVDEMAVGAVILLRYITADGSMQMAEYNVGELSIWETIGMLTVSLDGSRAQCQEHEYVEEDDDADDI